MHASGTHWQIGLDEAGYGPNLGPLVIGATAWRTSSHDDLYTQLADAISPTPCRDERLVIADSKAVYQPGGGLAGLETPVLACLSPTASFAELLAMLEADPTRARERAPWRAAYNPALPIDATQEDLERARRRLHAAFESAQIDPPHIRAKLVYPAEFNDLVDEYGSKGAALSHVTLGLARAVFTACRIDTDSPRETVRITLDKHGGRNRYAALVQHWFPNTTFTVIEESRPISRYRLGEKIELAFRSQGETEAPVALASMTAKLLREITMRGFNDYWRGQLPDLKPTAGYPVDAKRFKAQIETRQAELGINDRTLWRNR